jgi:hypothetical protein
MDELTSTEFRRRYATLKSATMIVALGRPIGMWIPVSRGGFVPVSLAREGGNTILDAKGTVDDIDESASRGNSFNTRPFTPVPKRERGG